MKNKKLNQRIDFCQVKMDENSEDTNEDNFEEILKKSRKKIKKINLEIFKNPGNKKFPKINLDKFLENY